MHHADAYFAGDTPQAATSPDEITRQELGLRLVYSFFLALTLQVASAAMALVVLLSFIMAFATREQPPVRLRQFGGTLCGYCLQVLRYICFLERKPPFPFSDWPTAQGRAL